MTKVYLASLSRKTENVKLPAHVFKVGISNLQSSLDRLYYTGWDEPHPISYFFPQIRLLTEIETDQLAAEMLESHVMKMIGSPRFHNWYEPKQISGITEMRTWNLREVDMAYAIIWFYKKYGQLLDRESAASYADYKMSGRATDESEQVRD